MAEKAANYILSGILNDSCCAGALSNVEMANSGEEDQNDNVVDLDDELANLDMDMDILQDMDDEDEEDNKPEERKSPERKQKSFMESFGFWKSTKDLNKDQGPPGMERSKSIGSKPAKAERSKTSETASSVESEAIDHDHQLFQRNELFSKHYNPSNTELREIGRLIDELGVGNPLTGMFLKTSSSTTLNQLFNVADKHHPSYDPSNCNNNNVVMKRGKIHVQVGKEEGGNGCDEDLRILILMTHGFIISKQPPTNFGLGSFTPLLEHIHFYEKVNWLKDLWQLEGKEEQDPDTQKNNDDDSPADDSPSAKFSFLVNIEGQKEEIRFDCESLEDKQSWLKAWERLLLQSRLATTTNLTGGDNKIVGWQHKLVQASLYTAAVTGQDFSSPYYLKELNELDKYNRLAPLHYAAIHNQVHIIHHLAGTCKADVEVNDDEGRTPMYYAERDEIAEAVEALKEFGAVASEVLHKEQHGALVEDARQLERIQKEKEKKAELMKGAATDNGDAVDEDKNHHAAAKSAHTHMREAMAGIHDRGKKIEELGEKTDELQNNTEEYHSLATKLRSKMEKKNKGLNFMNPFSK